MEFQTAKQRLFLTADKQALVGDGDVRAAFLYAVPGDLIRADDAERFGLVDGALPEAEAEAKPAAPRQKKPAAKPETKPAPTPEVKPAPAPETKEG